MRKRTKSLRWQLFGLMAAIAIVECVVLILSVALSGVFRELDAEAYRFFSNDSAERAHSLDAEAGRLIHNLTSTATAISSDAQDECAKVGVGFTQAYTHDELFAEICDTSTAHLIEFMNNNAVSASFIILNGSNADKTSTDRHSAVYIRDSAPSVLGADRKNLQLEVGPTAIARKYTIAVANKWSLDMPVAANAPYYDNPVDACTEFPRSELVRYGYWSPPGVILPGTAECISYTVPLVDTIGKPCGVVGFEISLAFFTKEYISATNIPYQGSFFAVTSGHGTEIDTGWVIPGTPSAAEYLRAGDTIHLEPVTGTDVYQATLEDVGAVYCSLNELTMYSKNSPFFDQQWYMVGMVQQSVLNEVSSRISTMLITTMLATLGVAFLAIFLLTLVSTRKIVGLSAYINELGPGSDIKFVKTDLREIDDLTSAVERLNRRINDSLKVTSKMMELTQLPLGGFEVANDLDNVMLTEYIYRLLHLNEAEPVTKDEWRRLYAELTAHPADGYSDVYRYDADRVSALRYNSVLHATEHMMMRQVGASDDADDLYQFNAPPEERQKWLRIIEAPTDNGSVGMILDATADIDEVMRLAHELDYDALTRLYNRNAFKREAFKKITQDPDKVGAMIFSDLDNLKHINDTYGHQMGDKLITTAADMFREFVDYGGIVARMSGDEFAIFLYGYDTQEEILRIIRKLYKGFKKRYFKTPDGETQYLSCSSGIAWYPANSRDVADLLKLSDYAMYEAKQSRKGTIIELNGKYLELNEESDMEYNDTQNRAEELRRLIRGRDFRFRYQPIVDLHTAKIYGYEAFMSPQSDIYTTPGEILAAARAESMLGPLESALVLKILDVTQQDLGIIGDRKIFVNSIPGQRLSDDDWDIVRDDYSEILSHIVMEVTEAENDDLDAMLIKLRKLRRMGIPVAIDDFGQGYSNEVRIIAMQPTIIKIDLELIRNLHADMEKQRIVRDLIDFAHAQGVKVAAEGVEMEMELETVVRFGMDYAQGFFIGRPNFEFQELSEPVEHLLNDLRGEDDEEDDEEEEQHEQDQNEEQ